MFLNQAINANASGSNFNDIHIHDGLGSNTTISSTIINNNFHVTTAAGLIAEMQSLIHLYPICDLKLESDLGLLELSLELTRLTIQTYQQTPLGPNLASAISQEVEECRVVLQGLLEKIRRYQQGLNATPIDHLWAKILGSGSEASELVLLRLKLSNHLKSLIRCFTTMNS